MTSLVARMPQRLFDGAIRVDRAPGWLWIALVAAALTPSWAWIARRMVDGSDDPLGLLALAALAFALAGAVLSTALIDILPPLVTALIGVVALAAVLASLLPALVAHTPLLGLAVLSVLLRELRSLA